jgi:hypothetical protein
MSKLSRRQKSTIANFLQVSRVHFGLCHRNMVLRTKLRHFRRTIIQSLLIAASVGIGGTVYAESSFSEGGDMRAERTARQTPSAAEEWKARSPVERMP